MVEALTARRVAARRVARGDHVPRSPEEPKKGTARPAAGHATHPDKLTPRKHLTPVREKGPPRPTNRPARPRIHPKIE